MRACRSTYWPVTSVALVVRSDVLPSAWACCSTVAKLSTGTWSVTLPEGGRARLRLRVGDEAAVGAGQGGQLRRPSGSASRGRRSASGNRSARSWRAGPRRRSAGRRVLRRGRARRRGPRRTCGTGTGGAGGLAGCVDTRWRTSPGVVVVVLGAWTGALTRGRARCGRGRDGRARRAAHQRADRAGQREQDHDAGGDREQRWRPATPATRRTRPVGAVGRTALAERRVVPRRRLRPARSPSPSPSAAVGRAPAGPRQDVVGTRDGDLEGRAGAGEERGEAVVVEHGHGPVSSVRGASPAPARAHRAGSAARRRRASCRRDFTVPGRRPMARAMSRSLRSA